MKTNLTARMTTRGFPTASFLAAILAAPLCSGLAAEEADLIKDVTSKDAATRSAAMTKLVAEGAESVKPLAKLLESEDRSHQVTARICLTAIAHQAAQARKGTNGAEEKKLHGAPLAIAEAYGEAKLESARTVLAELLSFVGDDGAIPILSPKLGDRGAREGARFALTRIAIDHPRALRPLREALEKEKDPEFQIALINSLGSRRDGNAVDILLRHAQETSPGGGGSRSEAALCAVEALSRIAESGDKWKDFLRLPDAGGNANGDAAEVRARTRIFDAGIVLGETLIAAKRHDLAGRIYEKLREEAKGKQEQCAALIGLGRTGSLVGLFAIATAVNGDDAVLRGAGEEAIRVMPASIAFEFVGKLWEKLAGSEEGEEAKLAMLRALAGRKEPEASGTPIAALSDSKATVRAQALKALEGRGDEKVAKALLEVVQAGGPAASEGAVGVLARLPGEAATKAIAEAASSPQGKAQAGARASFVRALAHREDPSAAKIILEAARSDEEAVRQAAYEGLGNQRSREGLPILLAALSKGANDRESAEKALTRYSDADSLRAILESTRAAAKKAGAAAAGEGAAIAAAHLRILGKRSGSGEALDLLLEGAKSQAEEVQTAALEGLAAQGSPKALPVLLAAAEKGPEKVRPAAVLGCLRFGKTVESQDRAAALNLYRKALALAPGKAEKKEAIEGLGRLADPESLGDLKPLLAGADKSLQQSAAAAILPAAAKLGAERKDEAVELIKLALPLAPTSPGAKAATEALRKFGIEYDIARDAGFITRWQILGPFPNPDNKAFEKDILDPDKLEKVSAENAKITVEGKDLHWKEHHSTDPRGVVNLEEAVGSLNNVGAYAYAEVTVPEEKRVSFKMGSDDSIVAWINGKKIHEVKTSRGVTVDQDQINGRLQKGKNRILLKILNEGSQWAFVFRITDRQGSPIKTEGTEKPEKTGK